MFSVPNIYIHFFFFGQNVGVEGAELPAVRQEEVDFHGVVLGV